MAPNTQYGKMVPRELKIKPPKVHTLATRFIADGLRTWPCASTCFIAPSAATCESTFDVLRGLRHAAAVRGLQITHSRGLPRALLTLRDIFELVPVRPQPH